MYDLLNNFKANDKHELIFITKDFKIIDAEQAADIILSWNTADIPDDIFIKIENILQKLQSDSVTENLFANEEIVVSALNVKKIERENLLHPVKSNYEAFQDMTEINDDIREKMNLITTKARNEKEINYISIRNDDNTVDVLVCISDSEIQEYLKRHGEEVPIRSAKEVFYDINNMFRAPLNFVRLSVAVKDPNAIAKGVIRDSDSEQTEEEKIREAVKSFGLDGHIYVAIDCFGERIYKIEDAIFKFESDDLSRNIEFLQEPRNMRNLNSQEEVQKPQETFLDEMLSAIQDDISEPEESYQELQEIDEYESETELDSTMVIPTDFIKREVSDLDDVPVIQSTLVEDAVETGISDDKFDEEEKSSRELYQEYVESLNAIGTEEVQSVEPIEKGIQFEANKFNSLIKKARQNKLNKDEKHLFATYIYLLTNERTAKTLNSVSQRKLEDYFYNVIFDDYDRANNVKKERIGEVMDQELFDALQYFENKELELLPKSEETQEVTQETEVVKSKSRGSAIVLIVIEIILAALVLSMFF